MIEGDVEIFTVGFVSVYKKMKCSMLMLSSESTLIVTVSGELLVISLMRNVVADVMKLSDVEIIIEEGNEVI